MLLKSFFTGLALARLGLAACSSNQRLSTDNPSNVFSSGYFMSPYEPENVFDTVSSTMWLSELFEAPAYVGYDFESYKEVAFYYLIFSNGNLLTRAPKNFQFQGSHDQNTWNTLDTQTNQVNWQSSSYALPRIFPVSVSHSYRYFRLLVTEDNDSRSPVVVVSIGEFGIFGCNGQQPPEFTMEASSTLNSYVPANAADGNPSTMWISESLINDVYLQKNLILAPKYYTSYTITFSNGDSLAMRAPKYFTLQGIDANGGITNLDTRSSEINWGGSESRTYTIANPGTYWKYRLQIYDDNDSRDYATIIMVSIGEFTLQ